MSFDPKNPTFEQVRELTRNGKERVRVLIYGSSVECRAKVSRTRAQIDFDLNSCNYDLRRGACDLLFDEYNRYRAQTQFRTRMHPHFNQSSIWFDVHRMHAEEWFQRVLRALQDPATVSLCNAAIELADYLQREADELLLGAIIETSNNTDGEAIVRLVAPAWLELVGLIQANPGILNSMTDRQFEQLVAGAYVRAGYDKVILTPHSADHGIDVIAEKRGLGLIRVVDQVKRFSPGKVVTANDVRALGFVALADGQRTKGTVTTTSSFAPRIDRDRYLRSFFESGRIELVDGVTLVDRLVRLMHGYTR